MTGTIRIEREGAIATVVLDRPDKLNALNKAMWRGLGEAMGALSADEGLRCVVIRGAGTKAFSAGADIAEFASVRVDSATARAYGAVVDGALAALRDCRHPTVALIRGACVGGGLEAAALCDLRIAGRSARFGVPIKRLGLVMGYRELEGLVSLAGRAATLEILLEGRVFGAEEALAKGLVTRVVEDAAVEAETRATCARIAEGAPLVARWHKRFVNRLAAPAPLTDEALTEAYDCFDTEDFRIGYRAFLEKRAPRFVGR